MANIFLFALVCAAAAVVPAGAADVTINAGVYITDSAGIDLTFQLGRHRIELFTDRPSNKCYYRLYLGFLCGAQTTGTFPSPTNSPAIVWFFASDSSKLHQGSSDQ